MIGFLIIKSFWDYWDRMGLMVLINVGYLLILGGGGFLISLTLNSNVIFYGAMLLLFFILSIYTGMVSAVIHDVVNHKSFQWKRFPDALKKNALRSSILAFFLVVVFFVFSVAFRFYLFQMNNTFSMVAFLIILWVFLFGIMTFIWFFPLLNLMGDPLKKHVKKCFLLTLDNTGLSVFMVLWNLLLIALSTLLISLAPGVSALLVFWHNGLKLLMYKYDYLEENPEANKKKIPWRALLKDERDKMGKRGIGDILRPGKMN